ncbi:hypothetical protein AB0I28_24275 [Phytomonospora sp. NPDC050363]|uniref:hypothetical protein n=1 Tax=Phytomonospora sp. NPDC050363 TaxID=3155642 RepID=UPI00340A07B3
MVRLFDPARPSTKRPWVAEYRRLVGYQWLGALALLCPIAVGVSVFDGWDSYGLAPFWLFATALVTPLGYLLRRARTEHPAAEARVSRDWLAYTTPGAPVRHVHRAQVTRAERTATAVEFRDGWDDLVLTAEGPGGLDDFAEALAVHGWPVPETATSASPASSPAP